jgi:rhamnopyranosyl-N-acetylglucosaminyl-diphospho-decaprenol beta-1,3/1,4-galactofuranosyltransferase
VIPVAVNKIVALIPTYRRKELLRQCLESLLGQEHSLHGIIVVDNESAEGGNTSAKIVIRELADHRIQLLQTGANIGGAGAFSFGLKFIRDELHDVEAVWFMDDDAVARPQSLAYLASVMNAEPRIELAASRVLWTDGTDHPRNYSEPLALRNGIDRMHLAARHSSWSIRSTTFVSCLIRMDTIRSEPLPYAQFFLGYDDIEYTRRILRRKMGVAVPASTVIHLGPRQVVMNATACYRLARNRFWAMVMSDGSANGERAYACACIAIDFLRLFFRLKWISCMMVIAGSVRAAVKIQAHWR